MYCNVENCGSRKNKCTDVYNCDNIDCPIQGNNIMRRMDDLGRIAIPRVIRKMFYNDPDSVIGKTFGITYNIHDKTITIKLCEDVDEGGY
jgi:hypothetical protein